LRAWKRNRDSGDYIDGAYRLIADTGTSASMTPFIGKGIFSFSCKAYHTLLPEILSLGATAIAGFYDYFDWFYDPAENASLSDVVFTSFHAPGFKLIES